MLTSQEQKTLQFIRNYLAQYGYAPRFKEIGMAIGVSSHGTIHRYVQSLEDKGYIDRVKGNSRGMSLVDLPLVSPPTIPLAGKIAAGFPIETYTDLALGGGTANTRRFGAMIAARSYGEAGASLEIEAEAFAPVVKLSEELGIDSEFPRLVARIFERALAEGYGRKELAAVFEVLIRRPDQGGGDDEKL